MKYGLPLVLASVLSFPLAAQTQHPVSAGELYKAASPSVVLIEIYGNDGKVSGSGSGFIVSADGAILTNHHVIAHTKRATVRLANGDAYDDVTVLDLDKRKDIALIKIKAVGLTPLKLGHSNAVQVGDTMYALGNPLGLFQNTLSEGILSSIRQADGYRLFQLSTPISHGSSGSPVFDSQGEVVGIIESTIEEGQNLNFAIPIDYAAGMLGSRSPRSLEATYEPPDPADEPAPTKSEQVQPTTAAVQPSAALKSDLLDYVSQKIALWTEDEAEREFGAPIAQRVNQGPGGVWDIFKYKSPVSGFSTIELSFERGTGRMSAAYCYPQGVVSWETVRARLGHHYRKQKEPNGTEFYIYQVQQRQDAIYVDSLGNVISIGIW